MSIGLKLRTYLRLGLRNLAQVALYRGRLRTGLHPVQKVKRNLSGNEFYTQPPKAAKILPVPDFWQNTGTCFGWYKAPLTDGPPHWHKNPFTGKSADGKEQPWWELSDFESAAGDIKTVWEASRFDWVLTLAQRAAVGDSSALDRINSWLANWCEENPAFMGSNWKCGQEASIRVMHLALAAHFLDQDQVPTADLVRLLEAHLARIQPTLAYAMAQDNNHGTSEAAALLDSCWIH